MSLSNAVIDENTIKRYQPLACDAGKPADRENINVNSQKLKFNENVEVLEFTAACKSWPYI